MSIKNILVSYNGQPSAEAALKVALRMAETHDAHLTGILSHGPSRMAVALGPWVTPDLLETIRETESALRAKIAAAFSSATLNVEKSRPGKTHWLDLGGDADESLMQAARVYDIVVMGRHESTPQTAHIAPHPDTIALKSGRPVMIVPQGFDPAGMTERTVLAWDGGRAAAAAMAAAMPVMQSKSKLTVLTVGDAKAARRRDGMDIVAHLARHGIMTDWMNAPEIGPGGVAAALIDMVKDRDAGLLIMGAYEHSKFAEDLLGGTTRQVLKSCPFPVLMAH